MDATADKTAKISYQFNKKKARRLQKLYKKSKAISDKQRAFL